MAVFPSWVSRLPERDLAYKKNTKSPEQAEKKKKNEEGVKKGCRGRPRPPGTGLATAGRSGLIRRQNWK
jgi:hypothetical protein